ncbi:hypothetical protein STEG23_026085 [Scotinomys teguina]
MTFVYSGAIFNLPERIKNILDTKMNSLQPGTNELLQSHLHLESKTYQTKFSETEIRRVTSELDRDKLGTKYGSQRVPDVVDRGIIARVHSTSWLLALEI